MTHEQLSAAPPPMTASPPYQRPQANNAFSRFDRMAILIMGLLAAAIGVTLLVGDRVGVTLQRVGPLGTARSTSNITLQFSENMDKESVLTRLWVAQITPGVAAEQVTEADILGGVAGELSWNGKTAIFRPDTVLQPGAAYLVSLDAGAVSDTGRAVLSAYRYGFQVRRPMVAYLGPADSSPFNVWIADPADPASARQVTFSPSGVNDFAVSPDGTQIAFSEKSSALGTSDIKLLDVESGSIRQITNCADADCHAPNWRPDGNVIAYERVELNSDFDAVGVSPTRIWLIDLGTNPPSTRPLFSDSQMLGYGLQWSADGNRITLFDYNSQGILMHQFNPELTTVIPSRYGNAGALSPDGTRIAYPEVLLEENQVRSYINIVDLDAQTTSTLTQPDDPIDDQTAVWSPDGMTLAVGRRYLDDRYTRGKQLYLVDPASGEAEPLMVEPTYQIGSYSWDANGTQILLQMFPDPVALNDPENRGLPEVWTIDVASGAMTQVTENAFYPRWVP